jgi:hypothetical protein
VYFSHPKPQLSVLPPQLSWLMGSE